MQPLAAIVALALAASADTTFIVSAPSTTVVATLKANRDTLLESTGCRVLDRRDPYVRVYRQAAGGGVDIWLRESADRQATSTTYRTTLAGVNRGRIRSWSATTIVQSTADGRTQITIRVQAGVAGLGENQLQSGIERSLWSLRGAIERTFR